ncbi:hypothetical protein Tco_1495013, partial [Tanacetum coccineum]
SGLRGGLGGAAVDVIVVVGSGDAEVPEFRARFININDFRIHKCSQAVLKKQKRSEEWA